MNNTKTLMAISAILMAATLVVGGTFAAATHSALAYLPQKDDKRDKKDGGNNNGNTVTAQINKQKASQSGWDNTQEQEAQNTICTHPASNGTCVSESEGAATNGGGGGGGGGGACNSPLVQASLFSETGGVLVCINQGDLSDPDAQDNCKGQDIDVFIDSVHKCLAEPPK
jgi:hypothetical protein